MSSIERIEYLEHTVLYNIRHVHPKDFCYDHIALDGYDGSDAPLTLLELDYIFSKVFTCYNLTYTFNYPSWAIAYFMLFKEYAGRRSIAATKASNNPKAKQLVEDLGYSLPPNYEKLVQEVLMNPHRVQFTKIGDVSQ